MRAKTYLHTCHHPKKDIREKKNCNLRAVRCWLVRRERANESRKKLERGVCSLVRYQV